MTSTQSNARNFQPIDLSAIGEAQLKVCTRPFRDAGPRVEADTINGRRIIHNYGHGGGGWSLSWGCAEDVLKLCGSDHPQSIAVIGAGAMGLVTATRLAEAGHTITIYSDRNPNDTRSAKATGTWSPDSRVALKSAIGPELQDRMLSWSRASLAKYAKENTEHGPRYSLRQAEVAAPRNDPIGFFKIDPSNDDIIPRRASIKPEDYGFQVPFADVEHRLTFNITLYTEQLVSQLQARGIRIILRHFASLRDILALDEGVLVNCTGYGAKHLFGDETLRPIRGQVGWLPPQEGVRYGVDYQGGALLARADGIVVQDRGVCESWGFDVGDENPDRAEFDRALNLFKNVLK